MRSLSIILCILGIVITAGACVIYFSETRGAGIACIVLGGGFFLTGVMIFLADLALRLIRRSGTFNAHFEFLRLKVAVKAELQSPGEETLPSGIDSWLDRTLTEIGIN